MNMIYWAFIGLGLFLAVWTFIVIPSERRHHERKLEIIRRQIEKRQSLANDNGDVTSGNVDDDNGRS